MSKLKVLPLVVGLSVASQAANAADLMSVAQDALLNNASLLGDKATLNASKANVDVNRGALLPQVTGTASVTRYHTSNSERSGTSYRATNEVAAATLAGIKTSGGSSGKNYNENSVQVQATQSLFDATNWYNLKYAQRQAAQQALNYANNRQTLLYSVANAYFTVLRDKEVLDTDRAAEAATKRQLDQVRQQFEVGTVAATDVREAEASYDTDRAARISQESVLTVAFESLEQLTGKQYPSIDKLSEDLPIKPPEPSNRQAWLEMGNSRNLALQAARKGIDASRAEVAIAEAGHLPTVEAVVSWDRTNSNRTRGFSNGYSAGLQASVPIYSGGSTSAQVRANTYSLESSQYSAEDELRSVVQNINSYFAQSTNNVYTVNAQKRAVESSLSSLKATREGYAAGTRTILDVLNSQNSYYSALQSYASSRYDYVLNMLKLRQYAGVLDVGTLQSLNNWLVKDNNPVRLDGKGETTENVGNANINLNGLGQ